MANPARPGATIFGPPLNPAKKCGSTNPVVMRTSALNHRRFNQTGTRGSTFPTCTRPASSNASWLTTRYRSTVDSPSMPISSFRVLRRCVPVAIRMTILSFGTCDSSSSTTGRTVWLGIGRVTSHTATATVWSALTEVFSGAALIGNRRACLTAPRSSGNPST